MVVLKEARKRLVLKEGQLSEGRLEDGALILTRKAPDPFQELSELIGDIEYSRGLERRTERRLFSRVSRGRHVSCSSS